MIKPLLSILKVASLVCSVPVFAGCVPVVLSSAWEKQLVPSNANPRNAILNLFIFYLPLLFSLFNSLIGICFYLNHSH